MSEARTRFKIMLVDDAPSTLKVLNHMLAEQGYAILVANSGEVALRNAASTLPDLVLLDVAMPGMDGFEVCRGLKADPRTSDIPVLFLSGTDDPEHICRGFDVGGVDFISKPFVEREVLARVRTHLELSHLNRELQNRNEDLKRRTTELEAEVARRQAAEEARQRADAQLNELSAREAQRWGITGFCGESAAFKHILAEVQQVQDANINVLICGESGTGKELVARAVHFGGQRGKRPFLPVNCGAIPGELMESMLFGHKRGAFTGATEDHPGYFALADGGTLFLDEIGDMPVPLQARLLRVLEDDYVMPLGSTQPRRVDVRVIAATHADLQQALSSGAFRRDLYFRLAGFVVEVPPLRQRREDIPLLLDHFCALFAAEMSMAASGFSAEALALLQDYSYPGNVRELKNLVEYALLKSGGRIIEPSHLNFLDLPPLPRERGKRENRSPEAVAGTASEEERIIEYIRQHGHITNSACRTLLAADSNHASYLLTRLWREGLLSKEGSKRWTCYRLCQPAEE